MNEPADGDAGDLTDAIRQVNADWRQRTLTRITFAWDGKDATDVDIEDYH